MTYRYFSALQSDYNNIEDVWRKDYRALVEDQFDNAPNVYTVEEETFFDSKVFQNVKVRIGHIINRETGEKVSDDYKRILFKDYNHQVYLGRYYKFDNNYWLAVNVDNIKSMTTNTSVRRCNNVLRWLDSDGGYHEIPCVLDNKILENRNYSTAGSSLVLPSGVLECQTQLNNETNLIKPNQRFLFGNSGNWSAYKVQGGGISNYNNIQTTTNSSAGLLKLTFVVDAINDQTDNLTLGIAEYYQYDFEIEITNGNISGNEDDVFQLSTIVKLNDLTVSKNVVWESDDEDVATVSSAGVLTLVDVGTCKIRASLENNDGVYDEIDVSVVLTPVEENQIVISPTVNYLYLDEQKTFTVTLISNSVLQADTFDFVLNPNSVPSDNYVYVVVDGNNFTLKNREAFLTDYLTITCTSNARAESKQFNIYLRGGW